MILILLAFLLALLGVIPVAAQPAPLECPLPPYQLPLVAPDRAAIDDNGDVIVNGVDAPFDLPNDLIARRVIWSDDGEVILVDASQGFARAVFAIRDGALTQLLDSDDLLALRMEDFRDAVALFNPEFVPGTHTVLFNTQVLTDAEGIYFELPYDLWSLDLDSGVLTEILPYGTGGQFAISPDGQHLVLMNFNAIWTTDITGQNPRPLFEGTVWIGLGESIIEPTVVWDYEREVPTFRTMLFPDHDPNMGMFDAPFRVYEFTLGDEVTSELLFSGQTEFLMNPKLSPDGYRVAEWRWQDLSQQQTVDLWLTSYGDPENEAGTVQTLLTSFDVPSGVAPFVQWADETHLLFGHFVRDGRVESRIDLCGEIVPLSQ